MFNLSLKLCILILILEIVESAIHGNTSTILEDKETVSRVLSRRKRFLTFPEGSSLQLVFCVQTSALITIGDIFLYGNTAALAWMLPNDPDLFHLYNDNLKHGERRADKMEVVYVDEKGKMVGKRPFRRTAILNPVFTKRSVDQNTSFKERFKIELHKRQMKKEYLDEKYMNDNSIEFHRKSRVGLYEKLEKLLTALGGNGRQCLLYKLCQVAKAKGIPSQGTFLQEILTVVFSLPHGKEFEAPHHKEYDKARTAEDCGVQYPGCQHFVEDDE